MSPHDRRTARLASQARADAKRVDYDDLDWYEDDWAYFEPLTDLDDYDEDESLDETYFGECQVVGEPRKQFLEPVWPPTEDVKEFLEALWSFEDERRQALQVKAATKNVLRPLNHDLFEKITRDNFAEIDAEVTAGAEAMRSMLRELAEARFVWVMDRRYNPAEELRDEYPQRYRSELGRDADWW